MDMDEEISQSPPLIGYFDLSDEFFAWRAPRPQQIERRRADLGDVLIFDILLSAGGIPDPDVLYPPSDVESLVRLLGAIDSSNYDALKKECLMYFLLKWHQDGRESGFAMERCIPPHFTALADAYWFLDSGINVPRAVSILADVRLNKDYASKILQAISLTPEPTPLILKYVRTAKPALTEPADIDMYALALAESSFLEAWRFQRTFNETDATRSRLLNKLIEWCIFPTPRRDALTTLLSFPLSPYEESVIHTYALHPEPQSHSHLTPQPTRSVPTAIPASSIAVLRDLVCVRLIQAGKFADAIKMDHRFASTTLDEQSKNSSQGRRKMVQDVYAALPAAERLLLDTELEALGKGKLPLPNGVVSGNHKNDVGDMDISMSQSWEEILPIQPPQANGHIPTPIPIPERAGAPRFGGPLPTNTSMLAAAPAPPTVQAPLIPISSAYPAPGLNGSLSSSRKSFAPPLSTDLVSSGLSSSQRRPRQSVPFHQAPGKAVAGPLFGGGNGLGLGSGSGLGASTSSRNGTFPSLASSLKVQPQSFVSAARQPNAFYQPSSAPKMNGVKGTFRGAGGGVSAGIDVNVNVDMDMNTESEDEQQEEVDKHEHEETHERRTSRGEDHGMDIDERVTLGFSVFGNRDQDDTHMTRSRTRGGVSDKNGKLRATMGDGGAVRRAPPGAFLSDDEEEEAVHEQDHGRRRHVPSHFSAPPQPPPSVRTQPAKSAPTASKPSTKAGVRHQHHHPKEKDTAKPKPKLKRKQNPSGRSLPGSLMDSDDDHSEEQDEEKEEQDDVAPLPARTSSPGLPRKASRKGRSSVSSAGTSDAGDDDDGVRQTRQTRRSTRLAGTASAGNLSAGRKSPEVEKVEKKSAGVVKGKKSAKAGGASTATAGRRKR